LEEVVRMRRCEESAGPERRVVRCEARSEIVEVEGRGMQRVLGRPRPGKDVRRILIVVGAAMVVVLWC
jgi:hypothetical protein